MHIKGKIFVVTGTKVYGYGRRVFILPVSCQIFLNFSVLITQSFCLISIFFYCMRICHLHLVVSLSVYKPSVLYDNSIHFCILETLLTETCDKVPHKMFVLQTILYNFDNQTGWLSNL